MEEKQNKYYVAYEDKGPSGPGIDSVPYKHLYIFTDYQKAKDFIQKITEKSLSLGRRQPKILGFWIEEDGYENVKRID